MVDMYLIEGDPITQTQIDEGIHTSDALGKPEWQLSDGPVGQRGASADFDSFEHAVLYAVDHGYRIVEVTHRREDK